MRHNPALPGSCVAFLPCLARASRSCRQCCQLPAASMYAAAWCVSSTAPAVVQALCAPAQGHPTGVQLGTIILLCGWPMADHMCMCDIKLIVQDPAKQQAGSRGPAQAACQAALKALLMSVLVPCSHSPPFLAQALALFRKVGRVDTPSALEVCSVSSGASPGMHVAWQAGISHPRSASTTQSDGMF